MAGKIIIKSVFRFDVADLPASYSGISVYRDVVLCWDHDLDPRLVEFVDDMDDFDRRELVAAHEEKGSLYLVWKTRVPMAYWAGKSVEVAGDSWVINQSRALADPFDAPEPDSDDE